MRVVFITPEEPTVVRSFYERVLPEISSGTAGMVIVRPIYKNSSWAKEAKRFAKAFGWPAFLVEGGEFAALKAMDALRRVIRIGKPLSIRSLARAYSIPVLQPRDVNDPAFLEQLRLLDVDVIVSVSCPQIFSAELLNLPRIACINVHSSMVPHYRGIAPTFWVLANGERSTGVTVMRMSAGIDDGEILNQRAVPIDDEETLRSLMRKSKIVAAELVLRTLRELSTNELEVLPNPVEEGSYFSFPTRADVARFRTAGRSLR